MGDGLSSYDAALQYLFVRTTGRWRFGLERTLALLDELGNPHRALRVIHVAGTNGKGSVCAMLDAVLRARGFRVARYTSPHLVDFRERMLIDGAPVSEADIVEFVERWTPAIERIGATFFEATTAMAFAAFARAEPDIAIVEVGLGGRLDATNVVDPLVSVVTSIGLDHTEFLGATWRDIAREKAGVFKPDRPAIIGERDATVRRELARLARAAHAFPARAVHDEWRIDDVVTSARATRFAISDGFTSTPCAVSLAGAHQAANASTALCTLTALPPPFATSVADAVPALSQARLAGRLQRVGAYVFDVAHNRDGAGVLAAALAETPLNAPRVAVLSVLRDKDWRGIMEVLAPHVDEFVLTVAPTAPAERTWVLAEAQAHAVARGWTARAEPDFDRALAFATKRGGHTAGSILVTGSFHTVGDAMARLHVSPFGD